MKEELQIKIIKLIGLFEYLMSIENFGAYEDLKQKYQKLLNNLLQCQTSKDINKDTFNIIESAFRIMMDAPPKDNYIGKYILDRMQDIYLVQKNIIQKNNS